MRYAKHRSRRGVLLLVILALLAMFGMVAVTFVVVASQARIAAEAHQRMDETTDPPRKLLNSALMQVLRGSTNPASAIGPHSLLEDVYAFNNAVEFSPSSVAQASTGGLIEVGTPMSLLEARRCVGGVLTVTDTSTKPNIMIGRSARIVDAIDVSSSIRLRILPFEGVSISDAVTKLGDSSTVLVNRTPFTGPGFTTEALEPGNTANRNSGVYANEDYDAADFQNMMLAAPITDFSGNLLRVIPSLHRPDLADYWNKLGTGVIENYILRPTKDVHGKFTGGNVNGTLTLGFDPIDGPWDVDNDGDGVMDSVWVDLGMPAQASPDGQLYKPLFAILCVDMDGRLNINAHGSLAQANDTYYSNPTPTTEDGQAYAGATGVTSSLLRGQGLGPAEVNLSALFSSTASFGDTTATQRTLLLTGGSGRTGRYGRDNLPGSSVVDSLCQACWFDYDYVSGYWPSSGDPSAGTSWSGYGTPPDLYGTSAMGIDVAGRPIWDTDLSGQDGENNPYEMNPMQRGERGPRDSDDEPFLPAELERILRCYDRDTLTLPPRLFELLSSAIDVRYLRHDATTDSVDTPVLGGVRDPNTGTWYTSLIEFLNSKHSIGVDRAEEMFGPDLAAGRKLNLNRPLPANDLVSRQELARHLFCLAMLVRDPAFQFPFPNDSNVTGHEDELTIKRIAQWAVNVVDFIDADEIMTPFEYPEDPFDSTAVWRTGRPSGDTVMARLVWGMERPVLLLSETVAFHDRRVADTALDPETMKKRVDKKENPNSESEYPYVPADEDLDQPRKPQGSLFVELYCATEPGTKHTNMSFPIHRGPSLYDSGKLHVTKRANNTPVPVWRLAITESAKKEPTLNNIHQRLHSAPATFSLESDQGASLIAGGEPDIPIERVVSFGNKAILFGEDPPYAFYYNRNSEEIYLEPGEYLLVGPRDETILGMAEGSIDSLQKIILDPTVSITDLNGNPTLAGNAKQPKGMVAQAGPGIGISISEPLPHSTSYYPSPEGTNDKYDPVKGKPLDSQTGAPLFDEDMLETRTYEAYKYVLLQRLADPSRPYNETTNPYRTVDWMPIDLTVFNGEDEKPDEWVPQEADGTDSFDPNTPWDPDDPDWDPNQAGSASNVKFDTRERGRHASSEQNFWEQDQFSTLQPTNCEASSAFFPCTLVHSLGSLNTTFGGPSTQTGFHQGDPNNPFPWITWNDRPPTNPYELLMVPATTAARHGWEFTIASGSGPSSPYTPAGGSDQYVYNAANVGYAQLMNFFDCSNTAGDASQLHRIFDFLATPSRFAGAQHYVSSLSAPDYLQPTYREPGKINLNTIYSEKVFRGLMNGFDAGGNLWDQFCKSRRGYDSTADPADYPTEFARPFRSTSGAHLWPGTALTPDRDIESGLLRSDPDNPEKPLFAFESTSDINDTGRNPYFRYQGLMRLANLTTTRSNVYAVWITVGYFEAKPTSDTTIPGGYILGREMGAETGEINRHRAFYMIDRSVPVGFVRGEDMNVENAIMLQRYIE